MAGEIDQTPSPGGADPVPDLIERYRLQRDAWIAQADELGRLRDEVRGSAEREAMEILTAARRDVRKVVMEARRELLVLSVQVQAALGEATAKTDPAALLHTAGISPGDELRLPSLIEGTPNPEFVPEAAVEDLLNEVQGDMAALAEDVRAIPLQAAPLAGSLNAPPPPASTSFAPSVAVTSGAAAPFQPSAGLAEAESGVLASPPPARAVPVLADARVRTFVALLVAIAVVVALLTIWRLGNPAGSDTPVTVAVEGGAGGSADSASAPTAPPAEAASELPDVKTSPALGPPIEARTTTTGGNGLSLVAEAVRTVWVRTTVDGRADSGRTLEAGQVIDVSAEQSISLRAGDAGAIVVSVNRGSKRPLGQDGQVVTRDFVVAGATAPDRTPAAPVASPMARSEPAPAPTPGVAAPSQFPQPSPVQAAAVPVPPAGRPAASLPGAAAPQVAVSVPPENQAGAPTVPVSRPAVTGSDTISPATALIAAARTWLDAYYRQDRATLAALSADNLILADERRPEERLPLGMSNVSRTLDRASVQIAADTAVLTAIMTEQAGPGTSPRVSPVSQVWVQVGGGQWKVRQARFVSEARLNQAIP